MRVGFVRNVGLAALGLAVAVTAACNDDPLSFDNDTTFDIFVNPSSMTVSSGVDALLESRAVNQGGEPTWADVVPTVAPACVTLEPDPDALEIHPPGRFLVVGGATIGDCVITLTAGGVEKTVGVGNVAGQIEITDFQEVVGFGQSVPFGASVYTLDEPPVLMGPFENTDAVWTADPETVATVDTAGVVTGTGAGEATIQACWYSDLAEGYEICDEVSIAVVVQAPTVTGISPATGPAFSEVTVQGSGFVSAHNLFIGGILPGDNYTLTITSITDTELKFIWPALPQVGLAEYDVIVGVVPDALSDGVSFVQTEGITAEPFEPENDTAATTPISIDAGGFYIGGTGNSEVDTDDWIEITVGVDGDYSPVLFWDSGQDMDLYFYDENLTEICHSWYSNPEDECGSVTLTAGTYYALIQDFSGGTFDTTYRFELFDDNASID
jgi:hypothetical protein